MPRRVSLPRELSGIPFAVPAALAAGIGESRLRSADLEAPFRGVRVSIGRPEPSTDLTAVLRMCRDYAPLLRRGQFFSHDTAAALWGAPLAESGARCPLHVCSRTTTRAPRRSGVHGHKVENSRVRVVTRYGLPIADATSTWLQLARTFPLDDLVVVADHLVLDPHLLDPRDPRPYLEPAELRRRLDLYRGAGRRNALEALSLMRRGAESRRETLLRLLLQRAGFPEPEVNPWLTARRSNWRYRGDLVYREWKTIVEYDGDQHRTDSRQYDLDIRRFDDFVADGWHVVRVRKRGIFTNPADTIRRVDAALRSGGWSGFQATKA